MIKLTEIFEYPKAYDPAEERLSSSYGLREVYINPQFIVYVRENEVLTNKAKNKLLVKGLHSGSRVANVYVNLGHGGERRFNVIGSPSSIMSDISQAGEVGK